MGVDAMIYGARQEPLKPGELLALSRRMCEAVGERHFWLQPTDKPPHHALGIAEDYEIEELVDGGMPEGMTVVSVSTMSRYYGEGYERGKFPVIAAMCEWLERNGFACYYGGDSDSHKQRWTEIRDGLWTHWAKVGGLPYFGSYDKGLMQDHEHGSRFCAFCDAAMTRHGWGASYSLFSCWSCGRSDETHDSGKTWVCKRDGSLIDPDAEASAAKERVL